MCGFNVNALFDARDLVVVPTPPLRLRLYAVLLTSREAEKDMLKKFGQKRSRIADHAKPFDTVAYMAQVK